MAWYPPAQTGQGTSAPSHAPTSGAVGGAPSTVAPGSAATPGTPSGAQSALGNLDAYGNLFGAAITGPNQAFGDYQINNLMDQLGLLFASGQYQGDLASQQAGFAMQNLGLNQQELGVQRGALNRQNALLPEQQALIEQTFGLQQGALDRQGTLLPAQQALYDAMYGQNTAQLAYGADQSHRANLSAATARGSVGSEGVQNRDTNIDVQHMYQQATLNNQRDSEHLSYNEQLAALKDQNAYLGIQKQQQHLSYEEKLAQNADAAKMLDIAGSRLGLSGQEVQARLEGALNQLGISTSLSVDQLLMEANKIQEGQLSPISNLIADIYQLSGIPLTGQEDNNAAGQSRRPIQGVS